MQYTVTTRCDKTFCQGHNRRDPRIVDKEKHINSNGHFEIWKDVPIRQMYTTIFQDALKCYNEQQCSKGHPERQIEDYYIHVKNSKQQNLAYEMIVAIGNKEEHPDKATCHEILKRYVDDWERRNPNLVVAGAYYHADEDGVPHIHVTFVPVATSERGLKLKTGWKKALQQQGFNGRNPQTTWVRSENKYLENLCKEKDLEIYHPQEGMAVIHQTTAEYKASMEQVSRKIRENKDKYKEFEKAQEDISELERTLESATPGKITKKISITEEQRDRILKIFDCMKPLLEIQQVLDIHKRESEKKLKKITNAIHALQRNFFDQKKELDKKEELLDKREESLSKEETLDDILARASAETTLNKAKAWDNHLYHAQQQRYDYNDDRER